MAALKSAQAQQQRLHRIGPRVHMAHRHFNVIVARYVLQRKWAGVLARLGQECVTETVQARVTAGCRSRSSPA